MERDLQQPTPEMLEGISTALGLPVSSLYLIAEKTSLPNEIEGNKEEILQIARRLEGVVTQFMQLTPSNQQLINDFMVVMLKAQRTTK